MTAEMEAEMDQIAAGEMTKDQVLSDSRDMLRSAYDEMGDDVKTEDEDANWRKFAREIWAGMDQDRILGPCIVCREAGRTQEDGSPEHAPDHQGPQVGQALRRLPGLERRRPRLARLLRPDLPAAPAVRGLYKIEEVCSVCERTPRLQVVPWRGRPWKLCLNDDCPSMADMKQRRAEREAAKAAKEAAEADGNGGKDRRAEVRRREEGRRRRPRRSRPKPRPPRSSAPRTARGAPATAPAPRRSASRRQATRRELIFW